MADDLRERIRQGEYPPGAALPSEAHLVQAYGLGRTTVRRAIAALRADGAVVVRHGYPTRVPEPIEPEEITAESGSRVSTRMPTPDERAEFGMPDGVPMLVVTPPDGLPMAYPGHQYAVLIE
ncbi:GntR family transcriptional regulator [Micromonospora sp. NBC_01655]|uniref:GntR family transcriptional regulator n=1 Tax=Micromonospora sp. NBC_01655 TaxID=2975983 RepID=UPI002258A20A|nr:GntR family transcriptional regulator [Micromonospora sp. NBC_01655]MCX4468982.1 GntR family transcriptional regulator [Micromonospora sp. NBC_01655]